MNKNGRVCFQWSVYLIDLGESGNNIQEGLINKLELEILKDTKLQIEFNEIETKFDININIYQNVTLDLIEIKKSNKIKLLTKYNLNTNSVLNIIAYTHLKIWNRYFKHKKKCDDPGI